MTAETKYHSISQFAAKIIKIIKNDEKVKFTNNFFSEDFFFMVENFILHLVHKSNIKVYKTTNDFF